MVDGLGCIDGVRERVSMPLKESELKNVKIHLIGRTLESRGNDPTDNDEAFIKYILNYAKIDENSLKDEMIKIIK